MTDPNSQDALLDLPPDQRRKVAEAYGKPKPPGAAISNATHRYSAMASGRRESTG